MDPSIAFRYATVCLDYESDLAFAGDRVSLSNCAQQTERSTRRHLIQTIGISAVIGNPLVNLIAPHLYLPTAGVLSDALLFSCSTPTMHKPGSIEDITADPMLCIVKFKRQSLIQNLMHETQVAACNQQVKMAFCDCATALLPVSVAT